MRYFLALILALTLSTYAGEPVGTVCDAPKPPDGRPYYVVELPKEQRQRFRNPDGSCVQCSIGMIGVACKVPAAEMLLWDSEYGPRVRGGSDPSRVKNYCDARGIKAYNVYGKDAILWGEWALSTGRPFAGTTGTNHCITYLGYTHAPGSNKVDEQSYIALSDNNSPQRIDWVSHAEFHRRLTAFSGGWVVILDTPPPAGPYVYNEWWSK